MNSPVSTITLRLGTKNPIDSTKILNNVRFPVKSNFIIFFNLFAENLAINCQNKSSSWIKLFNKFTCTGFFTLTFLNFAMNKGFIEFVKKRRFC